MATGTITLYEGVSKKSDKPYTALLLTVGEWSKMYFPESKFELEYIKKYLATPAPKDTAADNFFSDIQ